jgi:hypothetical protein
MFRFFKRRKAIENFVFLMSLDLYRRFGEKTGYSLEEVDRLLENGKYNKAFSAYAYAIFCTRNTFDSNFYELKVNCTYDGLRTVVGKRYFDGSINFDAASVIRYAKSTSSNLYYESNIGTNSGG